MSKVETLKEARKVLKDKRWRTKQSDYMRRMVGSKRFYKVYAGSGMIMGDGGCTVVEAVNNALRSLERRKK